MKISEYYTTYPQKERQKSYDYISCRESVLQNSTFFMVKAYPQHN